MPLYDHQCPHCGVVEVMHGMNEPAPPRCPNCGAKPFDRVYEIPRFNRAADQGWENENNGAGRYMGQMGPMKKNGALNPDTHCRSRAEAIDRFKRLGYSDIDKS